MPIETYTRTSQDVIDFIKTQFGDEADIQITNSHIIRWINSGQREIVQNNTTINERMVSTLVVPNKNNYVLETDPMFKDMLVITAISVNGSILTNISFNDAVKHTSGGNQSGKPNFWWIKAGFLNIYPIPGDDFADKKLEIYFTKAPTNVSGTGDLLSIPDNYFNALCTYVLKQAFEMDENFQAASMKGQEFDKEINSQQNQTEDHGNYFPVIQDDEDAEWV